MLKIICVELIPWDSQGRHSPMIDHDDLLEDRSWLKDQDWIEVNKRRRAYEEGGDDALVKAWGDLYHARRSGLHSPAGGVRLL